MGGLPEGQDVPGDRMTVKRTGARGDVLACEPVVRYYAQAGWSIRFWTRMPDVLEGCPWVYCASRITPPSPEARGVLIDLDDAYEKRLDVPRPTAIAERAGVPPECRTPSRYWVVPEAAARAELFFAERSRPLVVLHAGAETWTCRKWMKDRWRIVGEELRLLGYDTLELCGGSDRTGAGEVWPRPTWPDMAAVLARCACYVGVDSGPMWVALGLGVPVVGLFGPTAPHLVSDHPNLFGVASGSEMDGCHHRPPFPKRTCCCSLSGPWHPGMQGISPERVVEEVKRRARA